MTFAKGCRLEKKGSHQRTHISIARAKGLVRTATAASVDLSRWATPVMDQTSFGCCEGASSSGAIGTRLAALGSPLGFIVSVAGLYVPARCLDRAAANPTAETLPPLQDGGTETNSIERVLAEYGVRSMDMSLAGSTYIDLSDKTINKEPNLYDLETSGQRLFVGPYSVTDSGNQKLQDIKDAISSFIPVRVDSFVDTAFENWTAGKAPMGVPNYNDTDGGGHALFVVGFIGNNFVIRNSWGIGWGDGGNIVVSPEWMLQTDAFVWDIQPAKVD